MGNNKKDQRLPVADTGNASNPSPHHTEIKSDSNNQLFDERAEKYLRESANIEDEPDPQDQQEADELIKKENS